MIVSKWVTFPQLLSMTKYFLVKYKYYHNSNIYPKMTENDRHSQTYNDDHW